MELTNESRSRRDETMRGMFFERWNNGTFVTVAYELSSVTAGDATLRMPCMRSLAENRHQIVVWVGLVMGQRNLSLHALIAFCTTIAARCLRNKITK